MAFFVDHDLPPADKRRLFRPIKKNLPPHGKWLFDRVKGVGCFICKTCGVVLREDVNNKPEYLECLDVEKLQDDPTANEKYRVSYVKRNHYGGWNASMKEVQRVSIAQNLPTLCDAAKLPKGSVKYATALLLSTFENKIFHCDDYNEVEMAIIHILSENSFEFQSALRKPMFERFKIFDQLIQQAIESHRNIGEGFPEDFHNHRYNEIKEDLEYLCKKGMTVADYDRFWLRANIILDQLCKKFVLPIRSDISVALGIYCVICEIENIRCPSLTILENNYEIKAQIIKSCMEIIKDQILSG